MDGIFFEKKKGSVDFFGVREVTAGWTLKADALSRASMGAKRKGLATRRGAARGGDILFLRFMNGYEDSSGWEYSAVKK